MHDLKLKIITPKGVVWEDTVSSVTIPTADGEITVLPRHTNLFSLLKEGIITIRKEKREDFLAIGGGYLETNGEEVIILVSRAYGQDEIDKQRTEKAITRAKKILEVSKDDQERREAERLLRRSLIEIKLLKKTRKRIGFSNQKAVA